MDSELRNRKATQEHPSTTGNGGISSSNKLHAHAADHHNANANGTEAGETTTRDSTDSLTGFPAGHSLTDSQKANLAKESEEAAFGKTPNGTSTYLLWGLARKFGS